jgi:hypothetical protein
MDEINKDKARNVLEFAKQTQGVSVGKVVKSGNFPESISL